MPKPISQSSPNNTYSASIDDSVDEFNGLSEASNQSELAPGDLDGPSAMCGGALMSLAESELSTRSESAASAFTRNGQGESGPAASTTNPGDPAFDVRSVAILNQHDAAAVALTNSSHHELGPLQGELWGVHLEGPSISLDTGAEVALRATLLRASLHDGGSEATLRVGELEGHIGSLNADGSVGVNLGASATAVGVEATLSNGSDSSTIGLVIGEGAEASLGVRDQDSDGNLEVCARAAAEFAIGGGCLETN